MYVLVTGESAVYYTVAQLRSDNPDTSFPEVVPDATLAEWNVFPCVEMQAPTVDHTKNLELGSPALSNGTWSQTWTISDASANEIESRINSKWEEVRSNRNNMLYGSDWTQLTDSPLTNTDQIEWASYRQALRDITDQVNPFDIDWPIEPGA